MAFVPKRSDGEPLTDIEFLLSAMHEVNAPKNQPQLLQPVQEIDHLIARYNRADQVLSAARSGGFRSPANEALESMASLRKDAGALLKKARGDNDTLWRVYDLLRMIHRSTGNPRSEAICLHKARALLHQST